MTNRAMMFGIGFATCVAVSAAPAFGQAIDPTLIAAAKAEGTVMVYHTQVPDAVVRLLKAFEQKFGVRGQSYRAVGYDLQQRYVSESSSNTWAADVLQLSDMTEIGKLKGMGLVGEYLPASDAVYSDGLKIKAYAYPLHVVQVGIAYNSDKVTAKDATRLADWKGLLDPSWKGRIGVVYPTGGTTFMPNYMWMKAMPDQFGVPFLSGLAAQKPTIFTSTVPTMERLAAGEIDVAGHMNNNTVYIYYNKGAPVRMLFPAPTPDVPELIFMSRKPPHPNAAKLFLEWALGKEGQEVWMEINGGASARPDVTDTRTFTKETWYKGPSSVYIPTDWNDFSSSRTTLLNQWRSIFNYNP